MTWQQFGLKSIIGTLGHCAGESAQTQASEACRYQTRTAETGTTKNQAVFGHNRIIGMLKNIRIRMLTLFTLKPPNTQENHFISSDDKKCFGEDKTYAEPCTYIVLR